MLERRPHNRLGLRVEENDDVATVTLYPSGVFRGEAKAVLRMSEGDLYSLLDAGAQALEELRHRAIGAA